MSHLNKRDRMRILELSAEIAAEASRNTNVVFMIEFQEMLIEATYRKMVALLEADLNERGDDEPDDAEDGEGEGDEAPGRMAPTSASVWSREARDQAVAAAAPAPAAAPAKRSRARKPARD